MLLSFLLLFLQQTHIIKEILQSFVWKKVDDLRLLLISFQVPWSFNPSSTTSHCISCHSLPPVASFSVIYSVHKPSALCMLTHRPPYISWATPQTVSFCCALIIFSINLTSCSDPVWLNHQSKSVALGQFEGWFHNIKGGNSHAHCPSKVQHWDNKPLKD